MTFRGPKERGFTLNFSVAVKDAFGTPELGLIVLKKSMSEILPSYKVVQDGVLTLDGKQALYLSGRFAFEEMEFQNLMYGIFSGTEKYYTITFTARSETFGDHEQVFKKCAESARID